MKILFAVDGSECSQAAVATVLAFRCPAGTELKVISAVDFMEPLPSIEGVKEKEIAETEKLVNKVVEQLKVTHPNAVVTGCVRDGYASDEILKECDEWHPDLLLLGSHGRTGLDYFFIGSVARIMLAHAPCTVRIIRQQPEENKKSDTYNVILALDDTEVSEKTVEHILEFPWAENTHFKCVHVVPELHKGMLVDPDVELGKALYKYYDDMVIANEAWLEKTSQKLNNSFGQRVAKSEILVGDPRKVLIDLAKKWPADLIMMGSHGKRGLEKALVGSVSESVAVHADCSVEVSKVPVAVQPPKKKMHIIV